MLIAALVVALVTAFAALPHPNISRTHRALARIILAGVTAWLVFAIVMVNENQPPVTATTDPGTTSRTPPTVTYTAPIEPADTRTATTATIPVVTTTTAYQPVVEPTAGVTATTTTRSPQPAFEPTPPTPMPIAPKPDTVEFRDPNPPDHHTDFAEGVKQAIALSDSEQWREAADEWQRLLRIDSGRNHPFEAGAYYRLGIAYKNLNDWPRAAQAFEKANLIDHGKNATKNLNNLGYCYIKLRRNADAIAVYSKLLEIDPGDTTSRNLLSALRRHR